MSLIRLAWRNVWRNGRRTVIALVGVVLGVLLLVFMDGLFAGSDQAIFGNAVRLYGGNIQIHAPGYRERAGRLPLLPLADPDAVVAASLRQPGVESATQRIASLGLASTRQGSYPVSLTGIQPGLEAPYSLIAANIAAGRFLLDADGDAVVIGRGLADLLAADVGDMVDVLATPQGGTARERSLTVVGIYSLGESDAERSLIYVNLPTAESELGMPGQVTEVTLNLERVGLEHRVITALAAALPGYEIDSWETLRPELRQTLDVKQAYTTLFGIVVLFIACIGILNLLLMAVFERTREMGVLAALGMKGRQIMTLFVLEGAMIGVIGAVIGGLLGLVATLAVAHVGIDLTMLSGMGDITVLLGSRLRPVFAPGQSVVRCLAAVLMAALAALIPAWRASRQQPAEVLHHV